jgi:hypothetical protein
MDAYSRSKGHHDVERSQRLCVVCTYCMQARVDAFTSQTADVKTFLNFSRLFTIIVSLPKTRADQRAIGSRLERQAKLRCLPSSLSTCHIWESEIESTI